MYDAKTLKFTKRSELITIGIYKLRISTQKLSYIMKIKEDT